MSAAETRTPKFIRWTICVAIGIAALALPADAVADEVLEESLVYKHVGQRELSFDWTRPSEWEPSDRRPAIVFFHGGGWVGGKPGQFARHSKELAQRGLVCFRVQYRLIKKTGPQKPDQAIADVSDAFRFIRRSADRFGIDPERIAAGGGSAGGHLAAFLGMMDDDVIDGVSRKPAALCLFNPVYDNGPDQWGHKRVGDSYREYSPAHNISADDPPAMVVLGTRDKLISVETAQRFRDTMTKVGVESRLHLYPNKEHGFFNSGDDYRQTTDQMIEFLTSLGWISQTAASQ